MLNSIQDSGIYSGGNSPEADSGQCAIDLNFVFLPPILANEEVVSTVVQDLVQGISQDGGSSTTDTSPTSLMQQLENTNREWLALQILQRVFEGNMQALRSISGLKSRANNELRNSDYYFNNPFMDLSQLAGLAEGTPDSGTVDTLVQELQQLSEQLSPPPEPTQTPDGQCSPPPEPTQTPTEPPVQTTSPLQNALSQLMELLGQQWQSVQSGQTEWRTFGNTLNTVSCLYTLNNNRLNNQDTSSSAYIADSGVVSTFVRLNELL